MSRICRERECEAGAAVRVSPRHMHNLADQSMCVTAHSLPPEYGSFSLLLSPSTCLVLDVPLCRLPQVHRVAQQHHIEALAQRRVA